MIPYRYVGARGTLRKRSLSISIVEILTRLLRTPAPSGSLRRIILLFGFRRLDEKMRETLKRVFGVTRSR